MGEDTERRASSSFLSSSISSLQPADSRRQEGAAGTGTDVNVQLLAAIKSLQDQVADLQAKSTQAVAATQQCAVSQKKAPKELLATIHSVVKHLKDTLEKPMQWDTSLGFSSPENMLVTAEIATACVSDRYPAAMVQKATKKYFTTLKRRSRLISTNKISDARQKQRRLQRKHHKLQIRKATCLASTTLTPEQRDLLGAVLHVEYMSTEESEEESGEDECMGSARLTEMLQSLDRKIRRKRSSRAVEMCRKRCHGGEPSTKKPPPSCPAWAKVPDC
eukprot:Em0005g737a